MKIEVGMMVEIVDAEDFDVGREWIGHVGKVLRRDDANHWIIDGVTICGGCTNERALRPIEPPMSWDELKDAMKWSPPKEVESERL